MTLAGLCQICSTNDPKENLRLSEIAVRGAAKEGAKVIFLPEAADFIAGSKEECFNLSAPISKHEYTIGLQKLAKELSVHILAGIHDLPEPEEHDEEGLESQRVYNTCVVIDPQGAVIQNYRKVHMFDVKIKDHSAAGPNGPLEVDPCTKESALDQKRKDTGESARIRKGNVIEDPIQLPIGNVGLEICYDIRFPEMHTILRRKGAEILSIPSAFTLKTGHDHWRLLLRATAVMHQCFVIASAQGGAHSPERISWGESLIFSPWGDELARLTSYDDLSEEDKKKPMKPEWAVVDIDLKEVESFRGQIPLAEQKRTDIYGVAGEKI